MWTAHGCLHVVWDKALGVDRSGACHKSDAGVRQRVITLPLSACNSLGI